MRIRETIVAAAMLAGTATALAPREAAAQGIPVPPIVTRDDGLGTMSNITMVAGVAIVTLMPRIYYNDPEATIGWKARWHVSVLAPAASMLGLTLLVDGPIRDLAKWPRPGCTVETTQPGTFGSGCETYGGPSTQAFASWGATGTGLGIFLVDTFKYSDSKFYAPSFIGFVAAPLTLSIITSLGRSLEGSTTFAFEDPVQNLLGGALPGLLLGMGIGAGYALLQRPNCGYGNYLICW
jgi:hypothetical protein